MNAPSKKIIGLIHDAVARERGSRSQYIDFSFDLTGPESVSLAEHFRAHADVEYGHEKLWLEYLSSIPVDCTDDPGDFEDADGNDGMYQALLSNEITNFDEYMNLFKVATEEWRFDVIAILSQILPDEVSHIADFKAITRNQQKGVKNGNESGGEGSTEEDSQQD